MAIFYISMNFVIGYLNVFKTLEIKKLTKANLTARFTNLFSLFLSY